MNDLGSSMLHQIYSFMWFFFVCPVIYLTPPLWSGSYIFVKNFWLILKDFWSVTGRLEHTKVFLSIKIIKIYFVSQGWMWAMFWLYFDNIKKSIFWQLWTPKFKLSGWRRASIAGKKNMLMRESSILTPQLANRPKREKMYFLNRW